MAELVAGAGIAIDDTTPGSLKVSALDQVQINFGAPITESVVFARPVILSLPTVATDGATAPTYTLASSTGMSGAQTAWNSGTRAFAAGDVLHVALTNFQDATKISFAFPQA